MIGIAIGASPGGVISPDEPLNDVLLLPALLLPPPLLAPLLELLLEPDFELPHPTSPKQARASTQLIPRMINPLLISSHRLEPKYLARRRLARRASRLPWPGSRVHARRALVMRLLFVSKF
jgi:hypothetical protein